MALQITEMIGIGQNRQAIVLEQDTISKVCEAVILAMADGLPNEAHTIEVFNRLLEQTKELLQSKPLKLK